MTATVRRAQEADGDRVEELRRRGHAEAAEQRGGQLLVATERARVTRADSAGAERLQLVAELEGVQVGFLEAELLSSGGDSCLCRVGSLYVEPDARGAGAGEALMDAAKQWARERGAEGIDVLALPGAREVKNFLERAGFTGRLIVMHHRLDRR